jgi:FkbM family methyltransferase
MTHGLSARQRLSRAQRFARGLLILRDWGWTSRLIAEDVWPGHFRVDEHGALSWPEFDPAFRLPRGGDIKLLRVRECALRLKAAGAEIEVDPGGKVTVSYRGIVAEADIGHSLETFEEVVVCGSYAMTLPPKSVVWDVGANAGYASLYFARSENVDTVYACEPLLPTVAQLERNLMRNPELSHKVHVLPYAIAAKDGTATIRYTPEMRASVGLFWDSVGVGDAGATEEKITIRGAAEAFREIRAKHPTAPIVVKLDCEGAEREIIPALAEAGALADIHIITAEIHQPDATSLVELLEQAGFTVFTVRQPGAELGLMHAVRT